MLVITQSIKKQNLLLVLILFTQLPSLYAESLCMGPMPGRKDALIVEPAMSDQAIYIHPDSDLVIRIADKEMEISTHQGGMIEELEAGKKHLVEIRQNSKTKQSFWMNFDSYDSSDLCLWYYQRYGTISLLNSNDPLCRCTGQLLETGAKNSTIPVEVDVIGLSEEQLYSKYPATRIPTRSFLNLISKNLHPYHAPDKHVFLRYGDMYIVFELDKGKVIAMHKVSG